MNFFKRYCLAVVFMLCTANLLAAEWLTDFEKAKSESIRTGRPVFILFTQSDFSSACIRMSRAVFETRKFLEYADKKLVLMKADYPAAANAVTADEKKQNDELRMKYNITSYPTVLLLDCNGKVYVDFVKEEGDAEKYRRKLAEVMDFDAPKGYSNYVDGFVKKYKAPAPVRKEEKKAVKEAEQNIPKVETSGNAAEKKSNAPEKENKFVKTAGPALIPLDPEKDIVITKKTEKAASDTKSAASNGKKDTSPSKDK